jgi:hypothetical protein
MARTSRRIDVPGTGQSSVRESTPATQEPLPPDVFDEIVNNFATALLEDVERDAGPLSEYIAPRTGVRQEGERDDEPDDLEPVELSEPQRDRSRRRGVRRPGLSDEKDGARVERSARLTSRPRRAEH